MTKFVNLIQHRQVAKEAVDPNVNYSFDFTDKKLQALDELHEELDALLHDSTTSEHVKAFVRTIVRRILCCFKAKL